MKLHVTGMETIELTDPAGLCAPPVPQSGHIPMNPIPPTVTIPTPFLPSVYPNQHPTVTPDWRKKWQSNFTGDPIDSAPVGTAGEKWTKNMQLSQAEEKLKETHDIGSQTYKS